nr:MAG TPA: hypothetical protein [Caudoviricetes sp.]
MEALLTFTFKDFIAFMIPLFIGGLIFNRRRNLINGSVVNIYI